MNKDKEIDKLIKSNEKLVKELENMEVELYEYRQIFDSIVRKFGNDIVKIFTEDNKDEINSEELPN